MTPTDLQALLRIKHARAQRAATRLAQAREAARKAEAERLSAHRNAADHAAMRPAREQEVYAKFLAAPVRAVAMQADAALLSGLAAYEAVLNAQADDAAKAKSAADRQADTAARSRAAAQRATEAARALSESRARTLAASDERSAELEQEEQNLFRRGPAA